MLYNAYEMQRSWLAGAGAAAQQTSNWLLSPSNPFAYVGTSSVFARALEVFAHAAASRGKPDFDLGTTLIEGETVVVRETIEARKPFGQLKHFVREGVDRNDPRVLIVAPMSGHFATLLRGTVERLLPGHDVWITDWRDAKLVPLSDGRFDLNDYVDYIMEFLDHVGPGAHLLAVCQPAVPAYAAVALMGNHDRMMIEVLLQDAPPVTWFANGGVSTLNSYDDGDAPVEDALWMRANLLQWYVEGEFLFAHAMRPGGGDPELHLWGRPVGDGEGGRASLVVPLPPGLRVSVHGHTVLEGAPLEVSLVDGSRMLFLDAGAVGSGVLACYDCETGEVTLLTGLVGCPVVAGPGTLTPARLEAETA